MKTLLDFFDEISEVLSGYTKNQRFPDIELSLPPVLMNDAVTALVRAAEYDDKCPDGDPFEQFGKWHRAANIVQARMREQCVEERGYGLPLGDWSLRTLMRVARQELV